MYEKLFHKKFHWVKFIRLVKVQQHKNASPQCLENVVSAGDIIKAEERIGEALKQVGIPITVTITSIADIFGIVLGATTVGRLPALFDQTHFGPKSSSDLHLENAFSMTYFHL